MNEILQDKENVNLLWTGGWDSTFQLLQLLIIHRCRVTPFYLIDAERRSTGVEIRTMKRIKDHLWKEYPHTHELLQPTMYFAVADISPDSEITEAYRTILKEKYMGIQYDWLARFCKENLITDMQICITAERSHDKTHFDYSQIISESADDVKTGFRIDPKIKMMKEYALFRYYSFPIIKITKIQMFDIANQQGWDKIMAMTWFCHKPTRNMQPCGICNPCLMSIGEGLGWRIPIRRRIVSFFIRPLKSITKKMHYRRLK